MPSATACTCTYGALTLLPLTVRELQVVSDPQAFLTLFGLEEVVTSKRSQKISMIVKIMMKAERAFH